MYRRRARVLFLALNAALASRAVDLCARRAGLWVRARYHVLDLSGLSADAQPADLVAQVERQIPNALRRWADLLVTLTGRADSGPDVEHADVRKRLCGLAANLGHRPRTLEYGALLTAWDLSGVDGAHGWHAELNARIDGLIGGMRMLAALDTDGPGPAGF